MSPAERDALLAAFDPTLPISRAHTPPAAWYTSPALAALERHTLWDGAWQVAALAHQVASPGSYAASDLGQRPVVVTRAEDGALRALHNVCRHKAAVVCDGAGVADALVCPYHGWRYRLDGSLLRAPRVAGLEGVDRDALSLPALAVDTLGPLVLVNPNPDAPRLQTWFDGVEALLGGTGWDALRYHGHARWEVACNWKVFCDNYLDGGYHVPHLHPGLSEQLALDTYTTELYARHSVQRAAGKVARIGDEALYVWLYPNLMINRYGPALDVNVVVPLGPERCAVDFHWWFELGYDPALAQDSVARSIAVQDEDVAVSERVQRGLASGSYTTGRYAPRLEQGVHHFHRLLHADLGASSPTRA